MMSGPQKKGTILIPSGPTHDPNRMHLHVVCTDPDENGQQVIVPICTKINDLCDNTCTLQIHEHQFLRNESYVMYSKAQIVEQQSLVNGIASSLFTVKPPVNAQTFLRILNGICNSIQTPKKIKKYMGCDNSVI